MLILGFTGRRSQTLFNWAIYYKPHTVSSTTGGASSGAIGRAKKRRT